MSTHLYILYLSANLLQGFTKNVMGPVKWEAPESLQRKEYSEKTDVRGTPFSFCPCTLALFISTHSVSKYKQLVGTPPQHL
jgi:hypothetical protein